MANKSLTDLTARTATADSDLLHINSGGTDYKETKQDFLKGNFAHQFANTSTLTSQLDTLASAIVFGTVHGDISSNGHQTETGMPVNSNGTVFARIFSSGQMSVSFFPNATSDEYVIFKQGTWGTWEKRPTRPEITSLNNSLAQLNVTAGTFVLDSAQTSANQYVIIRQSGHVVSVWGYVSGIDVQSTTLLVGTITGVSLPAEHVRFLCNYGSNAYTTGVPCYAFVEAGTGKLYIYPPATGTSKAIYFNITWIR